MKAAPGEASENAVVVTTAAGATVTPRRVLIAPSLEVSATKGLARVSPSVDHHRTSDKLVRSRQGPSR